MVGMVSIKKKKVREMRREKKRGWERERVGRDRARETLTHGVHVPFSLQAQLSVPQQK